MSEKIEASAERVEHTPGPWTDGAAAVWDSTIVFAVSELGEEWPIPVADCNDSEGEDLESARPLEERRANARLIAASPDLLAAAKVVLAGLNARIERSHPSGVPVFDGIAELHAAVAKAEGRS